LFIRPSLEEAAARACLTLLPRTSTGTGRERPAARERPRRM